MATSGSYRVPSRNRAFDAYADPGLRAARRAERILDSLREEITGEGSTVRIRRIFEQPRELFRLEIDSPELRYQRTTLLDRPALDDLLAEEGVRERVRLPR